MPYKHIVTDSRGKVHTRTSADRQYPFAVVRHWDTYTYALGWYPKSDDRAAEMVGRNAAFRYNAEINDIERTVLAGSDASWCGRADLAQKTAASDRKRSHIVNVEIIPCTPVAIGRHAKAET